MLLLESSPRRVRRHYSTAVSLVGHAIILSGAVAVARPVVEPDEPERVITWHPPPSPPPPCQDCFPESSTNSGQTRGPSVPRAPRHTFREVTLDLPTNAEPLGQEGVIADHEWKRIGSGERAGFETPTSGHAIVDREVVPLSTNPTPRYPSELRSARIEGRVLARFVVDTAGLVIMQSVNVDAASHPAFGAAVIEALRRARFQPAEFRGRKVPQLVTQPFMFVIRD